MSISIIAAVGKNQELGKNGKLLWHLPSDLRFFKKTTLNHPVLMGRKTFESLPGMLPGRKHFVVSRNRGISEVDTISSRPSTRSRPSSRGSLVQARRDSQAAFEETVSTSLETPIFVFDLEFFVKAHLNDSLEIFVIGGGKVYQQMLKYAEKLYLTEIEASDPEADTFFPEFDTSKYLREELGKGEDNGIKFTFVRYTKIK